MLLRRTGAEAGEANPNPPQLPVVIIFIHNDLTIEGKSKGCASHAASAIFAGVCEPGGDARSATIHFCQEVRPRDSR